MKTNTVAQVPTIHTHEGARARTIDAIAQLRRSVMACMLWEDTFYENGKDIAARIEDEVAEVLKRPDGAAEVSKIALEARTQFKLRHVPLWLVIALVRARTSQARAVVADTLFACIQRADEMGELVSLYWKAQGGKKPLSAQIKKGLARAFTKFSAYDLAKYSSSGAAVKPRDVMFLVHPTPTSGEQAETWKKLAENKLESPDTWEVALSAGADKKEAFTRLLGENKLGALALLRNLRNMQSAGVSDSLIREALASMKVERVLPFRFITAARYAPMLEPELENAMFRCLKDQAKLAGKTVLVVDGSGSMQAALSNKSELSRFDAAVALAILLREICEQVQVIVFSNTANRVTARRGFALRDLMVQSAEWGGTDTGNALRTAAEIGYDRCIVITDGQSHTQISAPAHGALGYFINVASYENGIGYGAWNHIDGFSEAVVDYIQQAECAGRVKE